MRQHKHRSDIEAECDKIRRDRWCPKCNRPPSKVCQQCGKAATFHGPSLALLEAMRNARHFDFCDKCYDDDALCL